MYQKSEFIIIKNQSVLKKYVDMLGNYKKETLAENELIGNKIFFDITPDGEKAYNEFTASLSEEEKKIFEGTKNAEAFIENQVKLYVDTIKKAGEEDNVTSKVVINTSDKEDALRIVIEVTAFDDSYSDIGDSLNISDSEELLYTYIANEYTKNREMFNDCLKFSCFLEHESDYEGIGEWEIGAFNNETNSWEAVDPQEFECKIDKSFLINNPDKVWYLFRPNFIWRMFGPIDTDKYSLEEYTRDKTKAFEEIGVNPVDEQDSIEFYEELEYTDNDIKFNEDDRFLWNLNLTSLQVLDLIERLESVTKKALKVQLKSMEKNNMSFEEADKYEYTIFTRCFMLVSDDFEFIHSNSCKGIEYFEDESDREKECEFEIFYKKY